MSKKDDIVAGISLTEIKQKAAHKRKANQKLVLQLKKSQPKQLDSIIHKQHEKQFSEVDCLSCANCCKTTSPLILQEDITNIAKALKMPAGKFIEDYVVMDEDGDFVFNRTPCPFLGQENYCQIYEVRPKACREYPHTNQRKQISIIDISLENVAICPVVFRIFEHLEKEF